MDFEYELIHSIEEVHEYASDEEEEEISESGGICSGISVCWLERIIVLSFSPGEAWPNVTQSIQLQQYFENEDIALEEFVVHAGMLVVSRRDFCSYKDGMQFVWHYPGTYLLIITTYDEVGGHAYGYSMESNSDSGYLFDPNEGVYQAHSCTGLIECFTETGFAKSQGEYGMKLIVIKATVKSLEVENQLDEVSGESVDEEIAEEYEDTELDADSEDDADSQYDSHYDLVGYDSDDQEEDEDDEDSDDSESSDDYYDLNDTENDEKHYHDEDIYADDNDSINNSKLNTRDDDSDRSRRNGTYSDSKIGSHATAYSEDRSLIEEDDIDGQILEDSEDDEINDSFCFDKCSSLWGLPSAEYNPHLLKQLNRPNVTLSADYRLWLQSPRLE